MGSPQDADREYDLILVGASGFVGKLATMYLLQKYGAQPQDFRYALSARNMDRLKQVHSEIGGEVSKLRVFYGDCDDALFVDDLAGRARVIAASITPYAKHAALLVDACVRHGTHYVDLTGEMLWIRRNIDKHHAKAAQKGVRIVHACGLGSVPADLSVYHMQERLSLDGVHPEEFKFLLGPVVGSLGGGTVTSYATAVAEAKQTGQIRRMLSPTLLSPDGTPVKAIPKLLLGYDFDVKRWFAPLWLAGLDMEIVSRSGALLGYPEGVKYVEAQTYGGLLFGLVSAWITFCISYIFAVILYLGPTRYLLTKLRPPGKGPNRVLREKGFGKAFLVAKGSKEGRQVVYKGTFDIPQGDPGYKETSKMLIESALCIVLQHDKLPRVGGVLTPASAFNGVLMERLHDKADMTLEIHRVEG